MFSKITWYLKQLLPLTYRTVYSKDSKTYFCVWRMWFGRCFDIEEHETKLDLNRIYGRNAQRSMFRQFSGC